MTVQPFQQGSSIQSMVPETYANWVLINLKSSTQDQFCYFQISVGVQDWRAGWTLRLLCLRQGNPGWEVVSFPSTSIREWHICSKEPRLVISAALLSLITEVRTLAVKWLCDYYSSSTEMTFTITSFPFCLPYFSLLNLMVTFYSSIYLLLICFFIKYLRAYTPHCILESMEDSIN